MEAHTPASKSKRPLRLLGGGVAVVVIAAGIAWTHAQRESHAPPATGGTSSAPLVTVAAATRRDIADTLSLSAEFRPFQQVNVYAKVPGYVREMRVDVGSRVKAGDVLAVLEIPELQDDLHRATAAVERADQDVLRAKAAYDDAHVTHARLTEVLKQQPNLVAQQDIDQSRARDEAARAVWVAAQSAAREAVANRARFATVASYARIVAPFAGVVTMRYADTGSLVGAGTSSSSQAVVRLAQLDPLRLALPVPESAVPRVHGGTRVDVKIPSTNETIAGTIARVSGEVTTSTRTMNVEVDIPNRDLHLAPGMYAVATLVRERHPHVVSIPIEAATKRRDDGAVVYVLDKTHRIAERRIVTGIETPTQLEVVSGLEEQELVMIGGRGQHAPGQVVTPKLAAGEPAR
ncbi:MAG: efflux RND transporter periplasmic adaptor subunit [Burkholderiales bacterium]